MSDDFEAPSHHAITHNGETYIKLADVSVTFGAKNARITKLVARIAELEAVLDFYARENSWRQAISLGHPQVTLRIDGAISCAEQDRGKRARAALLKGKGNE